MSLCQWQIYSLELLLQDACSFCAWWNRTPSRILTSFPWSLWQALELWGLSLLLSPWLVHTVNLFTVASWTGWSPSDRMVQSNSSCVRISALTLAQWVIWGKKLKSLCDLVFFILKWWWWIAFLRRRHFGLKEYGDKPEPSSRSPRSLALVSKSFQLK